MKKEELLRHVGSIQQLAYVRKFEYGEGRANSLGAIEVKNGNMRFVSMPDKCMDICELTYKGMQINFLSKPGLNGRNHFDTHGQEALRSIMGGLFFTCGLENICAPYKEYPMHGRMRTTPAEKICSDAFWQGDDYVIELHGEMREAELFGENLTLRRKITSVYGKNEICIEDEIANEGFREEPAMLMYHCNFGFPFLHEGTRLILPTKSITPREEISAPHVKDYAIMDAPKDNEPEYVFLHDLACDENGDTFAAIIDDADGIGVELLFNKKQLPYFMEWKSTASGDYVIGLEPSNSCVYGRAWHEERDSLAKIPSQGVLKNKLTFRILEGKSQFVELEKKKELLIRRFL